MKQHEEEVYLQLGELFAVNFGVEDDADEIVHRLLFADFAHLVGVGVHLACCGLTLICGNSLVEAEGGFCEFKDVVAVFRRHSHQIGDHLQRQFNRDVVDEIAALLPCHIVYEPVYCGLDFLFQIGHPSRREAAVDDFAHLCVIGRIQADEEFQVALVHAAALFRVQERMRPVAEKLRMPRHIGHIFVASDIPVAVRIHIVRLLEDGIVLAQVGKVFVVHPVLKRLRVMQRCGSFHCVCSLLLTGFTILALLSDFAAAANCG